MKLRDYLADSIRRLTQAGVPSPRVDAQELSAYLLDIPRQRLILHSQTELSPAQISGLDELIQRRIQREPLQYIVGTAPFGPLDIQVGPGVFIPRPETEVLAEWAVQYLRRFAQSYQPKVVDLCTGSGALAAYIADQIPHAQIVGVELSETALTWARLNVPAHVQLVHADALRQDWVGEKCPTLAGAVDLIVCNPPYVPRTVAPTLEPEVFCDPDRAVFSGDDGMEFINKLPDTVDYLLKPGGVVGVEHDDSMASQCRAVFAEDPRWTQVSSLADLTGRYRFVMSSKM
ncbi:peptide chain release factor N(5)-glutamine methyltransferase [Corynebacterium sp. 3HC-13]|uniref:peptide chain release factor N(5)-glutamine methyltransferase n=1 Tax=Corynebacterium poyangense TaxID=2684405 RepID=UPI001CCB45CB|nr:peptide chain release factor N(5)-glutamine methyltransferase [Corynebacterium poyangense]MBZ8177076.1 peptide chain release factor N(5)-glutamine methyltransferase [Corynebacterium poyangense]